MISIVWLEGVPSSMRLAPVEGMDIEESMVSLGSLGVSMRTLICTSTRVEPAGIVTCQLPSVTALQVEAPVMTNLSVGI